MNIDINIAPGVDKVLRAKLGPIMRAKTQAMGEDMVRTAGDLMAGEFNLDRPYERRRNPGSRRAATALDFGLVEAEDGVTVQFRVLGGEDVVRRIIIMNYGSEPHDIHPTGNWELGGLNPKRVVRTRSGSNFDSDSGPSLAYPSKEGGYWVGKEGRFVTHPGTNGKHFLEAARDAALSTHVG